MNEWVCQNPCCEDNRPMKKFLVFAGALFLFTACNKISEEVSEEVESPERTETDETETSTEYPLYLTTMTHMEGPWTDDQNEDLFLMHVEELRYGMDLAEEYGAILTIETEKPFAKANTIWGVDIMAEVLERGHGVGTHCDLGGVGQKEISLVLLIEQMKENKALVDDLVGAENNHGCSGAAGENDWAQAAVEAGFDYINGIVSMHLLAFPEENRPDEGWTDEYIEEHFHDHTPENLKERIYFMKLENTLDWEPDETGIVVSNGELGRLDAMAEGTPDDCPKGTCPFTNEDVDTFVSTVREVDAFRDKSQPAKLTVYFPASNFEPENEEVLRYFFSEAQKLQEEGLLQWSSQWDAVQGYLESL